MKKLLSLFITMILITGLLMAWSIVVFADSGSVANPVGIMDNILQFIRPELFILIVFLYCVGLFLKKWDGFTKEWTIPYILLAVSFIITLAYISIVLGEGFAPPVIVAAVIQSVFIAAVTVFGNELIKQAIEKRNE